MLTHAAARAPSRAPARHPTRSHRHPRRVHRLAQLVDESAQSTEYSIKLTAEEARKCLKFDALVVADNERAIFVSGVARESDCERCGVVPGQRLRALTNPVDKSKLWVVGDAERLAFVKDAIRSTRAEEMVLVLEKEVSVTSEMVKAAMTEEEREEEALAAARAKARNETPAGRRADNGRKIEDRPDLYSDKWQGDEYVGDGFWNELTVGIAIAVAVPLVIVVLAATTRGTLWDTAGYF